MEGLYHKFLFGKAQRTCGRPTTQSVGWAFKFCFRKNAQIQECVEAQKSLTEGTRNKDYLLKLFPESRPFFIIRQLMRSSCSSAMGQ